MFKSSIVQFTLHFAVVFADALDSTCLIELDSLDFEADCTALNAVTDQETTIYRGNCLVAHNQQKVSFAVARESCNDFPRGGHLAIVPTKKMMDDIYVIFTGTDYHIGLEHGGSADIKKDWWWPKSAQDKVEALAAFQEWDPTFGDPDLTGNPACGYIWRVNPGVRDYNCGYNRFYICQYRHPYIYKFKEVKGGKIPPSAIGNLIRLTHRSDCGRVCGQESLCYSFAYNKINGNCLIIPVPTDQTPNPVLSNDYINFDKI